MAKFVEDVGKPFYAGWLSQFNRVTGEVNGARSVGGRPVRWCLTTDSYAILIYPRAEECGPAVWRMIDLLTTTLPSGGSRWWWRCPGCQRRVDSLYLPPGQDRIACRTCHGLKYRSQYTRRKLRRRNRRPLVAYDSIYRGWVYVGPWRRR